MHARFALAVLVASWASSACDIGRITVGTTAHILVRAQPALNQESDYQLARDAIPATLKTIEGFWVVDPDNAELLGLLTEGYCQYGAAFVEDDWEVAVFARKFARPTDPKTDDVEYQNARATRIFTRCLNYALRQLGERWQSDLFGPPAGVVRLAQDTGPDKRDPLMWASVALGSLINHNLNRVEMLSYQPTVQAMLARVIEIDQSHPPSRPDYAALPHIAFAMFYSAVGAAVGGKPAEARAEFDKALQLTGNRLLLARTLMAYQLGVITKAENQKFFHDQLKQVLETPPSVWPEQRLANEVAHRRARRYLSHEKEFFQ